MTSMFLHSAESREDLTRDVGVQECFSELMASVRGRTSQERVIITQEVLFQAEMTRKINLFWVNLYRN